MSFFIDAISFNILTYQLDVFPTWIIRAWLLDSIVMPFSTDREFLDSISGDFYLLENYSMICMDWIFLCFIVL